MSRPTPRKCYAVPCYAIMAGILSFTHVDVLAAGYFSDGPELAAGAAGDLFGTSATELEDVNGDGRWEFLIGAPGDNGAGAVSFWYGAPGVTVAPHVVWTGVVPEQFGWSIARIGDVNGDGKADFAVGAPMSNAGGAERGRVYVFYGGAALASGAAAVRANLIIDGQNGGDRFGWSISAAGDFNGDGRADFIVGAPLADNRAADAGAAYVIYGASGGPSSNLALATVLTGQYATNHFGWSVSDAGNFLTGNEKCVAVGAPGNDTHGGANAGAVYVYRGRLAGAVPDTSIDFAAGVGSATKANSQYGFAVRNAGRWDSDSYDDLAVGAPTCNQDGTEKGRVEIIFGAANPSNSGDRYANGEVAFDHLGWSLARVRNVAGTSAEDLLVGAPGHDQPATDAGRVYLFRGGQSSQSSASGLDVYANVPVRAGTSAGDLYGQAVASAGDFDGDGLWDFAIGAPVGNSEFNNSTSGFVHLIHSSTGPVATEMPSWHAEWIASDGTGQVALSFRLAEPVSNVIAIALSRRTIDAQGMISAVSVWSGPAAMSSPVRPGLLVCDGSEYRFVDPGPAAAPTGGSLTYAMTATTGDGRTLVLTDLSGPEGASPVFGLAVGPPRPNPGRTNVSFNFRAAAGDPLEVGVFDVRGRLVRHIYDGVGSGAWIEGRWDGRDQAGHQAAQGVYFLRARSAAATSSQRLSLVR